VNPLRRLAALLALLPALAWTAPADHVQVGAWLAPAGTVVPGQKLDLVLEIATDRWFTGGARIAIPEVPGLTLLQTEQFATNATENRGGVTWVVQRWTLDVYAHRPGSFTIPPITTRVQIDAPEQGPVQLEVVSPAVALEVTLPSALQGIGQWVASPAYSVEQQFDKSLEALAVGDAFERVITFRASDVPAMMLPALELEQLEGLATYPAPPVLDNSVNRGEVRATRVQRVSYVVEAEGRYDLPGRDFYWWDTGAGELRLLSLPAVAITVGRGAAAVTGSEGSALAFTPWQLALAGLVLGLAVVLAWLGWRLRALATLAPLRAALGRLADGWRRLRAPGLPPALNPGSNAAERKAGR